MKQTLVSAALLVSLVAGGSASAENGVRLKESVVSARCEKTDGSMDLAFRHDGDLIEIEVVGSAEDPLGVEYELVVEGASRTVHRGKSTLSGSEVKVLSKVKVTASDDTCARLHVIEDGGREYSLHRGACS